ncbi:Plant protein of unknown function (DUF641 [Striga hermonthica]|uniref:DUF641 domain-containing protein n=1 Tax=Striga hermonthica TaxID=68872 RepID=A0A9N7MKZ9_STRHE|nr:Plant protein of unknown function (DUF641 [Striga hermonthica]
MDSVKRSSVTPTKSRLARTFAKVLSFQAATGDDCIQKGKSRGKTNRDHQTKHAKTPSLDAENEKLKDHLINEAFLAKLFASLSSIKAAYAQMQSAQSPYDAEGIQTSDQTIVSELKNLSELKQHYLKNQINESSPEKALALAEIQEQKSLLKTYEVTSKKLDFQLKLKDSEITFLQEKLAEAESETKLLERNLNSSMQFSMPGGLRLSDLKTSHFATYHREVLKSVRAFVRLLVREMESARWDLDAAASSIEPGISFWNQAHKCFAFESFICRHMFHVFGPPDLLQHGPSSEKRDIRRESFAAFREMRSVDPTDYLARKPESPFALFCREKYLKLVHPKMEFSLFGNLEQRDNLVVGSGQVVLPETGFYSAFCEMAKRVWLLRCLGSCMEARVEIFQVAKGSRFSEVYMDSLSDDAFSLSGVGSGSYPRVAFTVVPGFTVGKTVIQCQVYLY